MASFSVTITSSSPTTADLTGSFTGGDAQYSYYRFISLDIDNRTITFDSTSAGGADSNFYYTITGLSPNTTYSWTATLGYYAGTEPHTTSYTDSGTVTTQSGIITWIYTGNSINPWEQAIPWVYTQNGWEQADPHIYTPSGWE